MSSDFKKYRVSSAHGLWDDVVITVHNGIVVASSYKKGVEIGSSFESLKTYWNSFEGENKYLITEVKEDI